MSTSGGGNGGVGRPTHRSKRQASMAATNALPTEVKNMEKAARKAKQEQAKSKKKNGQQKAKEEALQSKTTEVKKVAAAAVWAIMLTCSLGTAGV